MLTLGSFPSCGNGIWGGCAGGEEDRAYSCANGCGEGCKAQEPSKVEALSPAHSWGLAGLERIRKHIGKAASSSQVQFCWSMLDPATSLLTTSCS